MDRVPNSASLREDSFRAETRTDDDAAKRFVGATWYRFFVSFEVDVTLVHETLMLTPTQRIQQNDRVLRMIEELRNGFAKSGNPPRDAGSERR